MFVAMSAPMMPRMSMRRMGSSRWDLVGRSPRSLTSRTVRSAGHRRYSHVLCVDLHLLVVCHVPVCAASFVAYVCVLPLWRMPAAGEKEAEEACGLRDGWMDEWRERVQIRITLQYVF